MSSGEKQGMGCFAKGCIVLLVLGLIVAGVLGWGAYVAVQKVKEFTATSPALVPIQQATEEQFQEVQGRWQAFAAAVQSNMPGQLVLTADDINTLVAMSPDLKGKFHIRIENGQAFTQASIPLDNVPGFSGRYLNGVIGLKVGIENGAVSIVPQSIEVNGKPIPDQIMQALQNKDFADGFNQGLRDDPNMAAVLQQIKSLRIENDKLIIQTSAASGEMMPTPTTVSEPAPPLQTPPPQTTTSPPAVQSSVGEDAWITDYARALEKARTENKRVMMDFTGSDWCSWCIKLDSEVFSQDTFKSYAAQNLVLLKLDFPQRTPLSEALKKQNEELANRYGIKGYPTIIVVDAMGQEVTRLGYTPGGPSGFIARLESQLKSTGTSQAPAAPSKPAAPASHGTIVIEGYDPPPK